MNFISLKYYLLATISCCFISCYSFKTPEENLLSFLTHMESKEFEKAKAFASPSTCVYIDVISTQANINDSLKYLQSNPIITDIVCEADNNQAYCTYKIGGDLQQIYMINIGGKWLVDIDLNIQLGKPDSSSNFNMNQIEEPFLKEQI